ncbi:hypothetical protein ACGE24_07040 [Corynebacterium kroppenstedtii]|uniref:hypothetical protein n=1 Tax=Corynebacterium sp. PCR 32 TaxID=3351342 RepID=UPI0030B4FEEE
MNDNSDNVTCPGPDIERVNIPMIGNAPTVHNPRPHRRRHYRALIAGIVASGLLVSLSTLGKAEHPDITPTALETNQQPQPSDTPRQHSTTENSDESLHTAIDQIIQKYGGTAELATSDGHQVHNFGHVDPYPAWSSIKVPISIAALRKDNSDEIRENIQKAIRASDNKAAAALWKSLGSAEEAGEAVHQVLAEGGSPNTKVQIHTIRPPFSPFGQTQWSVSDSATFAANLPCIPNADFVIENMGHIQADQRWGLGTLPGARFKGGWGPDEGNAYLVRQLGYFDGPTGRIAIAMAAHPADGKFETAQSELTDIARAIEKHQTEFSPATCGE